MNVMLVAAVVVLCPLCATLSASLWVERQLSKALRERVALLENKAFFIFLAEIDGREVLTQVAVKDVLNG